MGLKTRNQSVDPQEWLSLETAVPAAGRDLLTELLWELDTTGVEEEEQGELVWMNAFFPATVEEEELKTVFLEAARRRGLEVSHVRLSKFHSNPDDWIENYKTDFHGFSVGSTFYIHPSWEKGSQAHPINLQIDPGRAFGTGTHESTRLCLLALERIVGGVSSVLDVGTGSGVLALAAGKLKPNLRIVAMDIDHQAAETARENFARNQAGDILLFTGELAAVKGSFELVVANLTQPILRELAPELLRLASHFLLVSGFTEEQECGVWADLSTRRCCRIVAQWSENGWRCLLLALE